MSFLLRPPNFTFRTVYPVFEEESNEYNEESLKSEMEKKAFELKPYTAQNILDFSNPKFDNNPHPSLSTLETQSNRRIYTRKPKIYQNLQVIDTKLTNLRFVY